MKPITINGELFYYQYEGGTAFYKYVKTIRRNFFLLELLEWLLGRDLTSKKIYEHCFYAAWNIEANYYSKLETQAMVQERYEEYIAKIRRQDELNKGEII